MSYFLRATPLEAGHDFQKTCEEWSSSGHISGGVAGCIQQRTADRYGSIARLANEGIESIVDCILLLMKYISAKDMSALFSKVKTESDN